MFLKLQSQCDFEQLPIVIDFIILWLDNIYMPPANTNALVLGILSSWSKLTDIIKLVICVIYLCHHIVCRSGAAYDMMTINSEHLLNK